MTATLVLAFTALFAATLVMAVEARTGRLVGRTERGTALRAGLFGAAACLGGGLLVALSPAEWVLALALVPLSALCYLRFAMLVERWVPGPLRFALSGGVLVIGILAASAALPRPLTRGHLHGALRGTASPPVEAPDAPIDPRVGRPVRA